MEKLFFQSSLPRSGSSLLQNLLAQNPKIYSTPTSGVLELIFAARGNYTDSPEFKAQDAELMKAGFVGFCREGMRGFYESITDKPFIVDKSRGWGIHYDLLNLIYPQPKIICMVRDLRDIFSSMESNYRKNPDKHNQILDWNKMQGISTPQRVEIWANTPPVGLAIERLLEMFRQDISKNILFVKFEDLCLNPEQEMAKIYGYLEIPFYQHDFNNVEQVTKEDDEVYGTIGLHTIRKKVDVVKSRANEVLGVDITKTIYNNYKWFYDIFGYKE